MTIIITILTIICAIAALAVLAMLVMAIMPWKEAKGPKPGTPEYDAYCEEYDRVNTYWKEYFEYQDMLAAQKKQRAFNEQMMQDILDSGQCPSLQPATNRK